MSPVKVRSHCRPIFSMWMGFWALYRVMGWVHSCWTYNSRWSWRLQPTPETSRNTTQNTTAFIHTLHICAHTVWRHRHLNIANEFFYCKSRDSPGRCWVTGISNACSSSAFPNPDSMRSCGEFIAPPQRITSLSAYTWKSHEKHVRSNQHLLTAHQLCVTQKTTWKCKCGNESTEEMSESESRLNQTWSVAEAVNDVNTIRYHYTETWC